MKRILFKQLVNEGTGEVYNCKICKQFADESVDVKYPFPTFTSPNVIITLPSVVSLINWLSHRLHLSINYHTSFKGLPSLHNNISSSYLFTYCTTLLFSKT